MVGKAPFEHDPRMKRDPQTSVARMIDHALLHPVMTDREILDGCRLAAELNLRSVCVKPCAVPLAVAELEGTETSVGTVIGFPHGCQPTEMKVAESQWALNHGATELDMVVNIGKVLGGDWEYVTEDIRAVVQTGQARKAIVKVIFETDYVTRDEDKRKLCQICTEVGADFVKTSTGFGFVRTADGHYDYRGATAADVQLMRQASGPGVGVKASGGIRDFAHADQFMRLGATRLGTSASQAIVDGSGIDHSSY